MIHLVGTNHISSQSVTVIKERFLAVQPDIIAIELDRNRLEGLLNPQKLTFSFGLLRQIGLIGYIFALVGRYAQKKMAKYTGTPPGSDMLYGVQLAKNNNLRLALIDRPMDQTLKKLSRSFTFKEKMRFLYDITLGLLFSRKQKITFSLNDIPEEDLISQLVTSLQDRYPSLYRVLIHERNDYMVARLEALEKKYPEQSILVVVGAGHVSGMQELLDAKSFN